VVSRLWRLYINFPTDRQTCVLESKSHLTGVVCAVNGGRLMRLLSPSLSQGAFFFSSLLSPCAAEGRGMGEVRLGDFVAMKKPTSRISAINHPPRILELGVRRLIASVSKGGVH